MKILIFNEGYISGGMDTFIINLISNWTGEDDKLIFIGNKTHPAFIGPRAFIFNQLQNSKGVELYCHKIPTSVEIANKFFTQKWILLNKIFAIANIVLKYILFIYHIISLGRLFSSTNYDRLIVVNGGHPGGDMCRAAVIAWSLWTSNRMKAIYNIHNMAVKAKWYISPIEYLLDVLVSRCSSYIVAVSNACLYSLLKRPGFKNFEKWRVIYNGIADAADAADAADINDHKNKKNFQNKFKFPDNAIVLLMLATYEPRKGHEFILSALKQIIEKMPNVYLLICGDGSDNEFDKVKKYASILEISQNIRMEKFHSDVQWLIKSADILVVPSQSYESFGLVIIEAMAKGIPVVATNVGGIPEVIVDNESGFCVDSKNIYEFSSKILQLISDPVLYSYFSKQGRIRFATKFTAKRMALEYRNILFD